MAKRKFEFENLEIGEDLGTKEIIVSEKMVESFAEAIESKNPWYLEESPFGGRIAPPTIFDDESLRMIDAKYERFGSIHSKQEWELKNPIPVGDKVTISARICDKYIKRQRGYYVVELIVIDRQGRELCRAKHHGAVNLKRIEE